MFILGKCPLFIIQSSLCQDRIGSHILTDYLKLDCNLDPLPICCSKFDRRRRRKKNIWILGHSLDSHSFCAISWILYVCGFFSILLPYFSCDVSMHLSETMETIHVSTYTNSDTIHNFFLLRYAQIIYIENFT